MLLFCEPPMYGRSDAGTSSTMAMYQPADTTIARPASSSCTMRLPSLGGPKSRYASANAGTTSRACSIFARKPKPTNTPAQTSHFVRPDSIARVVAQAPATISSTSSASGLLKRNISTATGVSADTAPAIRPAAGPYQRRTVAKSRPTVATPISACGTRRLHAFTPKIRAESAITHSEAGVLSTVIEFAASDEP